MRYQGVDYCCSGGLAAERMAAEAARGVRSARFSDLSRCMLTRRCLTSRYASVEGFMVSVHDVERRGSSRLRGILTAVGIGLLAFAASAAFGEWQLGMILGVAVVVGNLAPPFSKLRRR